MRFLRAAVIDEAFYRLPLTNIERSVYFYLSSRCATQWGIPEATMVAILRTDVKRIRAALLVLEDMRLIKRTRFPRPRCHEYLITLTTEPKWGIGSKRTYGNRSKRTPLIGANAPIDGVQTPPSPATIDQIKVSAYDADLLQIGLKSVRTWPFGRRPMGDRGVIAHKHQRSILELVKTLISQGCSDIERITENLDAIRDYLSTPKDTLSDDIRDFRGKTLSQWMANWPDQLHRAQSFLEMRKRNVVRMPNVEEL